MTKHTYLEHFCSSLIEAPANESPFSDLHGGLSGAFLLQPH